MSLRYNRVTVQLSKLRFMLLKKFYSKFVIGAGGVGPKGYLKTEGSYLDVESRFDMLDLDDVQEIISEHVWEHLDDPLLATNNCYNSLRRFGKLIVSVPHPSAETPEEFIKWGHKTTFTAESLTKMFKLAGFKEVGDYTGHKIFYRDTPSIIIEGIKLTSLETHIPTFDESNYMKGKRPQ